MSNKISSAQLGEMYAALTTGREGPATLEQGYQLATAIAAVHQAESLDKNGITIHRTE